MKFKYLILIAIIFLLTGCYNYNEINNYAIATGISIDKENDQYLVSVLISNSQKDQGNSKEKQATTSLFQGSGKTIIEALNDLEIKMPKVLYLGHITIVVLSEEFAKDGIYEFYDFILRNPELIKNFFVAVSKNAPAYKTLSILSSLENFPSQNIISNIESTKKTIGLSYNISFSEILYRYLEEGYDFLLPTLTIDGDIEEADKKDNVDNPIAKAYLKILPLSMFKDYKLIDITTESETFGFNILNNEIDMLKITSNTFYGTISANIKEINCSKKLKFIDNKITFNIEVNFDYDLISISDEIDLDKKCNLDKIHNDIQNIITSYINESLNNSIKNNYDPVGFGNMIYKNNPNYWNNIKNSNYLSNVMFYIKTNAKVNSIGTITNTIKEYKK